MIGTAVFTYGVVEPSHLEQQVPDLRMAPGLGLRIVQARRLGRDPHGRQRALEVSLYLVRVRHPRVRRSARSELHHPVVRVEGPFVVTDLEVAVAERGVVLGVSRADRARVGLPPRSPRGTGAGTARRPPVFGERGSWPVRCRAPPVAPAPPRRPGRRRRRHASGAATRSPGRPRSRASRARRSARSGGDRPPNRDPHARSRVPQACRRGESSRLPPGGRHAGRTSWPGRPE